MRKLYAGRTSGSVEYALHFARDWTKVRHTKGYEYRLARQVNSAFIIL
jgi:hypothetical protein